MSYTFRSKTFENRNQLAYYIYCEDNKIPYEDKSLSEKEMKKVLKFVYSRYGSSGLKKYKNKTAKDFKRKIIEVDKTKDLSKYKNKNIKLHYKCNECDRDVFTAYSTYIRFKDHLCKSCRKNIVKKK